MGTKKDSTGSEIPPYNKETMSTIGSWIFVWFLHDFFLPRFPDSYLCKNSLKFLRVP